MTWRRPAGMKSEVTVMLANKPADPMRIVEILAEIWGKEKGVQVEVSLARKKDDPKGA